MFEILTEFFASSTARTPTDKAIEAMRAFAGTVIKFPAQPDVERIERNRHIASSLNADPSAENVRRLEDLYSVPKRSIAKSFSKTTGRGLKHARAAA